MFFAVVLLSGVASGCRFDIDKIYEHSANGAGQGDAGADAAQGAGELPEALIDLWQDQTFVNDRCVRCAKAECKAENEACRNDENCAELTACVAASTDPDTHARCRANHVDWLAEEPNQRALGGPFYTCVFRDKCAEQCATHTDVSCLGEYSWASTSAQSVKMTFQFVNALDQTPADGIAAKVCLPVDIDCASPVGKTMRADAEGKMELELPTPLRSFAGFLDLEGEGWYPTLVHLGWPVARPGVTYMPIVTEQSVQFNILTSGVQPDPTRGQLQIRMFGCAGVGMRDVYFEADKADEESRTWYARPALPNFDADRTGDLGSGGIINVKPGLTTITARLRSDDTLIARTSAPVRPGYLTIVVLAPLDTSE